MEWSVALFIHVGFSLILLGLTITGIVLDDLATVRKVDLQVTDKDGLADMNISGLKLTSRTIHMEYNRCALDGKDIEKSPLYTKTVIRFEELAENGTRDPSIGVFAHINIDEEGTEIIGDIDNLPSRSTTGRVLAFLSLAFQCIVLILYGVTRRAGVSLVSRHVEGVSSKLQYISQVQNALAILGGAFLWWAILVYSTMTPILLPHLFREARDRCEVVFNSMDHSHYEMRTLAVYVRENSLLNGATGALFGTVVLLSVLYTVGLFLYNNIRSINTQSVSSYRFRTLSWYNKILSWPVAFMGLFFGVWCCFWAANVTRERGYDRNMFYWLNGAKVSQKTGLSKTGTLLDSVQAAFNLFTLSPPMIQMSTLIWLIFIPVIVMSCTKRIVLLSKIAQDFAILLVCKAFISWTTVAPTTISMMEKPVCFDKPESDENWSWIHTFDTSQSCNDTMFSIHAIYVFVPAMLMIYFVVFGGVLKGLTRWAVTILIVLCALSACLLVVAARYQYTADMHIGICVVICYMLTQMGAYRILFDEDHNKRSSAVTILEEKILPVVADCALRLDWYLQGSKGLNGLKVSSEEVDDISSLYRTTQRAIQQARDCRQKKLN